jgi:hypothetical protein
MRDLSYLLDEYSKDQIIAWKASPFAIVPCTKDHCENLAIFPAGDEEFVGIFRSGHIYGTTFQILSHLVHYHTMHPVAESFMDCPSTAARILETIWFEILRMASKDSSVPLVEVAPWPYGKEYALTIRHDVDRLPDPDTFKRLISFEQKETLGVSWYWIPWRTNGEYLTRISEAGQEIGLHAMKVDRKPEEITKLNSNLQGGEPVSGETWHGGGGGDYWIGPSSVKSAIGAGLSYTELMPTILDFPYNGLPIVGADGKIEVERIIGVTYNCSTDAGVIRKNLRPKISWMQELISNGYYCMLLNHPDSNLEVLQSWVERCPAAHRQNFSCKELARWWSSTHDKKNLMVHRISDERADLKFSLWSKEKIIDLCLRVHIGDVEVRRAKLYANEKEYEVEWKSPPVGEGQQIEMSLNLSAQQNHIVEIEADKPLGFTGFYPHPPVKIGITAENSKENIPRIRISWEKQKGRCEVALKDIGRDRWVYHLSEDDHISLDLVRGSYIVRARRHGYGRISPWSGEISVEIQEEGTMEITPSNTLLLQRAWIAPDCSIEFDDVVFVGGAPRSGTTLLQNILCSAENANPLVAEAGPVRFIVESYARTLNHFRTHPKNYFEDEAQVAEVYKKMLTGFFEHIRKYHNCSRLILKEPALTLYFRTLKDILGTRVAFVCTVRDPRDAIASMIAWGRRAKARGEEHFFQNEEIKEMAQYFNQFYSLFLSEEEGFYNQLMIVRYEDLVSDPDRCIQKLSEFANLELDPHIHMKTWNDSPFRYKSADSPVSAAVTSLYGKPVSTKRIGAYKDYLSEEQIGEIERRCGKLLRTFYV